MEGQDLQVYEAKPMTLQAVKAQVNLIQEIMREVMTKDEHYGIIPGCKKPSLYKPGAEKLSLTFRMAPKYEISIENLSGGHRTYEIKCLLYSIGSERFLGEGVGSGSTMEGKYRYRDAKRKCPECAAEAIIKGKPEYGGGWLCYHKKGGCGAKFRIDDESIVEQDVGKVEHGDPADYYNTALKMAKKRAHVDAVLTVTAASDIFTQDVEDLEKLTPTREEPESPEEDKPEKLPKAESKGKVDEKAQVASDLLKLGQGVTACENHVKCKYLDWKENEIKELNKWAKELKASSQSSQ